jgi:hypothetical protein
MTIPLNSEQGLKATVKKKAICPKCKTELDARVPRGFIAKNILFFLPLKRYVCYRCQRKRYVLG